MSNITYPGLAPCQTCHRLTSLRVLQNNNDTCGRHGFVAEEDADCTNGPEDGCTCALHVQMMAVMD